VAYTYTKNGSAFSTFKLESLTRGNRIFLNDSTSFSYQDGRLTSSQIGGFRQTADLATQSNALPGSGEIQGMSDYVDATGTILHQAWYRGNIGYIRDVPIENGKPNYSKATIAIGVVDLNKKPTQLKGTGDFEAVANYISCASN